MRRMKAYRAIAVPLLAIAVSCAMIVGAISMCLSNVVENVNPAERTVTLSVLTTDTTPGGDLPNYTSEVVMMVNQSYDMMLNYTTTRGIVNSVIVVEFTKVSLGSNDVNLTWWNATSSTWLPANLVQSGDVLRGTLGPTIDLDAGMYASYYANLTYQEPGNYTFKLWVEAELA